MHKTLLIAALLAVPLAAAQAQDAGARHRAWIAAQKIDIQPTLTVRETQVPADSVNQGSSGYQQAPSGAMSPQGANGMQAPGGAYGSGNSAPHPGQQSMPSHQGMQMQGGAQMK